MKGPKAEKVESMFDNIAADYDRLNHILSLDVDRIWRRRALSRILDSDGDLKVLDLACGTGDFSIEIAKHATPGTSVLGVDLSEGMLAVMRNKVIARGLSDRISTVHSNCECLDLADNSFDRVTIAFGIRNVEDREKALREMLRVLKPGGRLVILELSVPSNRIVRWLYELYFLKILPMIGGSVSGDKSAYRYLPASVENFPGKKEWMETMRGCGFFAVTHKAFSLGICRMYTGDKL